MLEENLCPTCGCLLPAGRARRRHLALCAPFALEDDWASAGGGRDRVIAELNKMDARRSIQPKDLESQRIIDVCAQYLVEGRSVADVDVEGVEHSEDIARIIRAFMKRVPMLPAASSGPVSSEAMVVFRDRHVLILAKESGMLVTPANKLTSQTSALNHALSVVRDGDGPFDISEREPKVFPINRIDRETSGCVCFGLHADSARSLRRAFDANDVEKTYIAICRVAPGREELIDRLMDRGILVEAPISKAENRASVARRSIAEDGAGLGAQTFVRVLRTASSNVCVVAAQPKTGRTHQVRLHLCHIGLPILGDDVYRIAGRADASPETTAATVTPEESQRPPRMMLHALSLQMDHPVLEGRRIGAYAEPPADFTRLLGGLELGEIDFRSLLEEDGSHSRIIRRQ